MIDDNLYYMRKIEAKLAEVLEALKQCLEANKNNAIKMDEIADAVNVHTVQIKEIQTDIQILKDGGNI